jgi:transcription antitermination protein NusB|tara:strand:- start:653 stop:1054 length:402 start_codon:yes stop_codon:yes gene_type:complete
MTLKINSSLPRVRVIQKLYGILMNPEEPITYNKSRYKKFIKDVVSGTIERKELIEENLLKNFSEDLNLKKTDKLLKIIIFAAVFELMFKLNNPTKVIISEYLKTAEFFLENIQIKYLNALLDKVSKKIRNENT